MWNTNRKTTKTKLKLLFSLLLLLLEDDHSFVNAKALASLIESAQIDNLSIDNWKEQMREREMSSKKSILGFFGKPKSKSDDNDNNARVSIETKPTSVTTVSAGVDTAKMAQKQAEKTSEKRKESPVKSPKAKKPKLVEGQSTLAGFFGKKSDDNDEQ